MVPKADSGKHHDFLVVHFLSLQSVMGFCDIRIHHLWGKELQAGNDDVSEALRIEIEMFINPRRPRVAIHTTLIDIEGVFDWFASRVIHGSHQNQDQDQKVPMSIFRHF